MEKLGPDNKLTIFFILHISMFHVKSIISISFGEERVIHARYKRENEGVQVLWQGV